MTEISSTLFTVSWSLLFSFLRATAAGLNRCLCSATCRVDSASFPFGGARPRLQQTDRQTPPSGQAGLTCEASAEETGRRGGTAQIYFSFFDPPPLRLLLAVTLSAAMKEAQSSGCNNIRRQAQFTACIKGPRHATGMFLRQLCTI